jgi:MFS family permease
MERKTAITSAIFQREFLSVFIVVVNVLSWYFPLYIFFESALGEFQNGSTLLLSAFGVQFAAAIGFGILGNALAKRFPSRDAFLSIWMIVGIIASALMITLETFNMTHILLVSFLLGFALGLGLPSCFEYFGDHSTVENRGLLAGITFLASMLFTFFIGLLLSFSTLVVGALILAAWRGIGFLSFLLVRPKQNFRKEKMIEVPYRAVLHDRLFLLYLLPWAMFCLINFIEIPVEINLFGEDFAEFMPIAEYGIGGFVALIGGWFADSVGRKRIIIVGFITLGIGYGVLGLFHWFTPCWYLYIIIDGIAWGIFLPMFYLVIWSELAGNRVKGKYYLIGLIPFLIASYAQIFFAPYAKAVEASAAFSLASFFLFIAVLPLLYAPETMPQKKIELKRLRKFADDAKKAKEKYERKMKG